MQPLTICNPDNIISAQSAACFEVFAGLICEQVVVPKDSGKLPPVVWSYYGSVPRQKVEAPPEFVQFLKQLEQSLTRSGCREILHTLFSILQHIVGTASNVSVPAVAEVLPDTPVGVSPLSVPVNQLFARCNLVRFGRFVPQFEEMQSDLTLLRTLLPSLSLLSL